MKRITVLLADDHPIVREELRSLALQKGYCPFCLRSTELVNKIQVGYRRTTRENFAYKVLWVEWQSQIETVRWSLPICNDCSGKYLDCFPWQGFLNGSDPRPSRVLMRMSGWMRGVPVEFTQPHLRPIDPAGETKYLNDL